MAGFQAQVDHDTSLLIAQVKLRIAASPGFRDKLRAIVQGDKGLDCMPSWTAGLEYLDQTLESPRLRALLKSQNEGSLRVSPMQTERDAVDAVVRSSEDLDAYLEALVDLGLTVVRKWDRADTGDSAPAPLAVAAYDRFTVAETRQFASNAAVLLRDYVAFVPKSEPVPFMLPVWQGVLSAFLYSLLLILFAVLVRLGGHDLIDILRDALKPG